MFSTFIKPKNFTKTYYPKFIYYVANVVYLPSQSMKTSQINNFTVYNYTILLCFTNPKHKNITKIIELCSLLANSSSLPTSQRIKTSQKIYLTVLAIIANVFYLLHKTQKLFKKLL